MTKFILLFCVLGLSWLQAAQSRHHRHLSSDAVRSEHLKLLAEKFRDSPVKNDPYFRGNNDVSSNQPEITAKDLPANGETFEGDMIMDDSLRRSVLGLNDKRSAVGSSQQGAPKHWPNGRVPYKIDDSLKQPLVKRIAEAIRNFNHFTCVRFVPAEESDQDYVVFKDGNGCSSSVGRQGGPQYIHLALGCQRIGTVQHEMMHSLGIIHEQSRSDRDNYVKVRFDHIKQKLQNNFRRYSVDDSVNMGIAYDYYSVMHYGNYAFSDDHEATIISKFDKNLKFGQRIQWTCLDVKMINRLYPCHKYLNCKNHFFMPNMTKNDVLRKKRDELAERYRESYDE